MHEEVIVPHISDASYPPRSGNVLRPLIDGAIAFDRISEAVDLATSSIWVTVTFMWPSFVMPGGRGSALEILSRAAARGLDVRVIFWRPDPSAEKFRENSFWGAPEHYLSLEKCARSLRARWDRSEPGYCQHQKSWVVDAGTSSEKAFVGGINLNPHSVVGPGHKGANQNHDIYLELAGPAVADVHHNFVQRWNEASERDISGGRWGDGSETSLEYPTRIPKAVGNATVQIQRTIHSGRYTDGRAVLGGAPFPIGNGEKSNLKQYLAAIRAARRTIYLEHQHIEVQEILDVLKDALARGVHIVAVVPAESNISAQLYELTNSDRFTLSGLSGRGESGERFPVWVHSKLMIVDGEWGTIGSCNLHHHSLFGNSELNAAFWDKECSRSILSSLFFEHVAASLPDDDVSALQKFREISYQNRQRGHGNAEWRGIAFSLVPGPSRVD